MRVMHDAKSAIRHVSRAGVGLSVVYVYLIFMFVGVEIEFQRDRLGTDDLLDLYLTSSDGSFLIQPSHDRRTSKTLMNRVLSGCPKPAAIRPARPRYRSQLKQQQLARVRLQLKRFNK
ncbi:uncharacterized [Tachysurus ichikawai]